MFRGACPEQSRRAQHDKALGDFLRCSGAANQQPHQNIYNYCRRDREEERTDKSGPERGPNDAGKNVPMQIVVQAKLTEMHAASRWAPKAPAPQMIFGKIDRRHRPNHHIMQRHGNRSCDFVAAENPRYDDRQQRLQRIQRTEPEEDSNR